MPMTRVQVLLPVEVVSYLNGMARKDGGSLSDQMRTRVLANLEGLSEMEWDDAQCKWVEVKQDKVTA